MAHRNTNILTILILLGLVAGALVGEYGLHDPTGANVDQLQWLKEVGNIVLIRPLKVLIIPLILFSVISGITRIGDPAKLGIVGIATLVYYLATMFTAVTLGACLVTWIAPGVLPSDVQLTLIETSQATAAIEHAPRALSSAWLNILYQIVPVNIFKDMVNGQPLGIIAFAIAFGLAITAGGDKTKAARDICNACFEGLMILVRWVIWLTPIGVFFLVAWTVGKIGFASIKGPLGWYMATVLIGLAVHGFVILPLVLYVFSGKNPYQFMWQMKRALMTAIGTDSSSATLPVTIDAAENEGECSKRAANFVLPLGATVNMDGTALYEAVAVVFLFQLFGIDLDISQLAVVVITATLAAIGAAGIPSAGLVTMVIVITAVNMNLTGSADGPLPIAAIGIIIGVDRILDMCRTAVNVWGDAVGAKIITRIAPD
ncbi:MAG: dicarboxylate/amino acid:cation symporter [Phycisphaerae bacterium]|jgi:Na+/H+-dicarboxylate symporter|nr:dicarboxylate/amino acid:cation symporter [Phycisphaerae bacterium]MBT5410058.1 dicarboxylate/amino acid:cation symporter [Phycisphaerae bacterium]MBT6165489.1 dicarboxylate/amino acid:cation symporter [Phycisphaerae bacterium]MBT7658614.1 dicarboxylate/amino acid:cation symporter [Phycisphaerae bacterium]